MKPVIWRGPLVMSATERLLKGAVWEPLDILVIDTPPGTGDIHLSLMQNVPISGALLVSTPQLAALKVTQRGSEMFRTLKVPILGIVENMSSIKCSNCGTDIEIFKNQTEKIAKEMKVDILERIPIEEETAEACDKGVPMSVQAPDSLYGQCFTRLAKKVLELIETQKK